MTNSKDSLPVEAPTRLRVDLCAGVLPVWARHLAASRSQSEGAVSEMMQAFASLSPHMGRAQQQSQQIDQVLGRHDGAFSDLAQECEKLLLPLLEGPLPADGAQAIQAALGLVRDAVNAVGQLTLPASQETQAVAEHVERMYVGFQYQDRISQMLALLETDIARLQQVLDAQGAEVPDLETWMARLESQYAMSEQRDNHTGFASAEKGGTASDDATFF